MTCPHCTAATERMHGKFDDHCRGCRARRIARGIVFHNAKTALPEEHDFDKVRDRYRELLAASDVTHAEVRAAAASDFENTDQQSGAAAGRSPAAALKGTTTESTSCPS